MPASLGSALASQGTCHGLSSQHSWERYDLPSASGRRHTNLSFGCGQGGGQVSCLGEPLWLSLTSGQSGEVHVSLPNRVPLACSPSFGCFLWFGVLYFLKQMQAEVFAARQWSQVASAELDFTARCLVAGLGKLCICSCCSGAPDGLFGTAVVY